MITKQDIRAINDGAQAALGRKRLTIEVGRRNGVNGPTIDTTQWDDGSYDDDFDLQELAEIEGQDRHEGLTIDLYCYWNDRGQQRLFNLDARWNGTAWSVYDPFAHGLVAFSPTRKSAPGVMLDDCVLCTQCAGSTKGLPVTSESHPDGFTCDDCGEVVNTAR